MALEMNKKSIFCLVAALLIVSGNLFSQSRYDGLSPEQTARLISSPTRFTVGLSGEWEMSFDEANWQEAVLPISEPYEEAVYFKRVIKFDSDLLDKMVWHLHFLGIDHQAEIYMNRRFVGRYFSAMTPFEVRIPENLIAGQTNEIMIKVSPAEHAAGKIKSQHLFAKKIYTGIIRELFLTGTPKIWVDNINYNTTFASNSVQLNSTLTIKSGDIENMTYSEQPQESLPQAVLSQKGITVQCELISRNTYMKVADSEINRIDIGPERTLTMNFEIPVNNPALWSTDNPNLYELKAVIRKDGRIIDELSKEIGFRNIYVDDSKGSPKIFLNGEEIELKGVTYIEDQPELGQTMTIQQMEEDVKLIKTLGANIVRTKYSPPHPYFAQLCNRHGLLLMIELPLYNVPADLLQLDEIKVHMENIARQLSAYYNHYPSVAAWGISEGIEEGREEAINFSKNIIKLLKENSDKLIYKIINSNSQSIYKDGFDLIGIKRNYSDYNYKRFKGQVSYLQKLAEGLPVFLSYGAFAEPDNHNGYSDSQSLEFQAYLIRNYYLLSEENKCAGSFIFSFNDYELNNPVLIVNNDDRYLATSGLTNISRSGRLSYRTLRTLFNNEKEPLLNAGSYYESTPLTFIIIGVIFAAILIFMANRFRRFREYFFRSIMRPYNFYADIRDQRIMSSSQSLVLGFIISVIVSIFIASILYFYRTSEIAQYILMLLIPVQSLQEFIYNFIWVPELLMAVITLLSFLLVFIISFFIRIAAFLSRARIFFNDTLTMTIWSGVPLLILLPFSVVLIRLLVISPNFILFFIALYFLLMIWVALRLLKSIAVVFDRASFRVYSIGLSIFLIVFGIPLGTYHFKYSIFSYAEYLINVMLN